MIMLVETLKTLFSRDLNKLISEIQLYKNEADLWLVKGQINNSTGNLCLHIVGNLNTYIGKELGKTNYVRNRDLEFSAKNIPRQDLLNSIESTISIVNQVLDNLDQSAFESDYPVLVFKQKTSIEFMLVHLATHLAYHLGQVNYHRRLVADPA